MSRVNRLIQGLCFSLIILLFIPATLLMAQDDSNELISKQKLIDCWKRMADYTIALADKMPAESYDYTPVEELRTFADQMYHIAGSNYFLASAIFGGERKQAPDAKDKATVMAYLKESFDVMTKGMESAALSDLKKPFRGGTFTGFDYTLFFIDHLTHTRGIALMYLRMKGIAPPQFQSFVVFGS